MLFRSCRPSREVEIFSSFPKRLWASLARIDTPTLVLYGEQTFPFVPQSLTRWARLNPHVEPRQVAGGHCFMQEHPQATVTQIEQWVLNTLTGQQGLSRSA